MFAAAFEDPDSYERAPPSDAYLARALAREANIVLTAQSGDEVVGGLVAYLFEKFEQERSEIYI